MMLSYLKDFRLAFLIVLIVALAALDLVYGGPNGLHLGVEFVGGTQIPVQLEHSVDPQTMSNLITILEDRLSTFGLNQVTVEGIGSSAIYITIPSASPAEINNTISIIQSQGVFQGIVNGQEALNGSSLVSGSIGAIQPTTNAGNVTWSVAFFITQQAAEKFSKVVFGQGNKPLYMFLDRPESAIILINASLLNTTTSAVLGSSISATQQALQQAALFGNRTLAIETFGSNSTINSTNAFLASHRSQYSKVILQRNTPSKILAEIASLNYTTDYVSKQNMTPTVVAVSAGTALVDTWPAIGLLSAPVLNPSVTNGNVTQSYEISGAAPAALGTQTAKLNYAVNQSNKIVSILRGGALSVHVIVQQPQTIPPTLGKHFEYVSALALVLAVIAVSITISLRYKKLFLVVPILFTTLAELFIIGSLIGIIGTIDLSAVAGMIAVIGTGVDAQIIITDEVLSGLGEHGFKTRLNNAFYIIWADAALLAIAMMPLLFSTTLFQIVGFAESTILGVLFGAFLTRPAYGSIINKYYHKESK